MPSPSQQGSPISVNSPLSSINKSILAARTPISSPPYLLISFLRQNPNIGFTVDYPKVGGLGVQSIFNKNVIKLKNNKEYIKEAANAVAMLYAKQGYDYKADVLTHLKTVSNSNNRGTSTAERRRQACTIGSL